MTDKLLKYFNGLELSASVWLNKYAAKGEETPLDMHRRMAKEYYRADKAYQTEPTPLQWNALSWYGKYREELTAQKIFEYFDEFKTIIPQGSVMATLGTDMIASLSNCWVADSPLDSYAAINKTDGDLIFYYKRRGGVGIDLSKLRPSTAATNNTAKSSTGAVSFMERFSNTTREVAMAGRRGALMLSIDVNHPDVLDFATIKQDRTKVTGANVSIRVSNEFMEAVRKEEDYILRFPCEEPLPQCDECDFEVWLAQGEYNTLFETEGRYFKKIKAKEYWDTFIKMAKENAEPGLLYWDNALDTDPSSVYPEYMPICTNPCGEQFLPANDSCRLSVLNLTSFIKDAFTVDAFIDYKELYETSYEHARLGDNLVDLEAEYIQRIINKIKSDPEPNAIKQRELDLWVTSKAMCLKGRRAGLGITGLGDALAMLGLEYGSDASIGIIEEIMETKMRGEMDALIDMAILRGTFEGCDPSVENTPFYEELQKLLPDEFAKMQTYGRRSVNWSTIAPTGSVSLLANNCTSGCEPLFSGFYMRRKKVNPNESDVRVDFVDDIGDSWTEYPVLHPNFSDWITTNYPDLPIEELSEASITKLFNQSPWAGSTANDIDWISRVKVQAALQKYTTNAISSTINLPATVTHEQVSEIYMKGWELGLKGQTIYVDGSRSGVLITKKEEVDEDEFQSVNAPKRPKSLSGKLFKVSVKGQKYTVVVGLFQDKPYEVFATQGAIDCPEDIVITKKSRGKYIIDCENSQELNSMMSDEEVAITRLTSTALRHGCSVEFLVSQLNKTPGDLTTFSKAIARALKGFIPDGKKISGVACEECGSESVIFEEGCNKCKNCGHSAC